MAVDLLTFAVEVVSSALLTNGRPVWLGASAPGSFTVLTTLNAHNCWRVQDAGEQTRKLNTCLEYIDLIGRLALVAALIPPIDHQGHSANEDTPYRDYTAPDWRSRQAG